MHTMAAFFVRKSAKCVGTNPGAIQLTRVSGLISAARAYKKFEKSYSMYYGMDKPAVIHELLANAIAILHKKV